MRRKSTLRVVQAHVVFRHGDRTPTYNCMEPMGETAVIESFAWARKLPRRHELATLRSEFVSERADGVEPRDRTLGVFGSLTRRGVAQTRALGRSLRAAYGDDVDRSDCAIYSSNFTRTVRSAQSVVGGFLDLPTVGEPLNPEERTPLKVRVTTEEEDHINVYAHVPGLARRMSAVVSDPDHPSGVHAAEQAMKPLARALENAIPAYAMFIKPFSWIGIADHFYCREMRVEGDECEEDSEKWVANAHVESLFHEIDGDGDGELSLDELRAVLDKVCDRRVSDGDVRRVWRAMIDGGKRGGGGGAAEANSIGSDDGADAQGGGGGAAAAEVVGLVEFSEFVRRGLPSIPDADLAKVQRVAEAHVAEGLGDGMEPRLHAGATRPGMEAIVGATMAHLCRRFHAWYRDEETLRLAVGRMMRLVHRSFEARIDGSSSSADVVRHDGVPFVFHSGHDVTIAPVVAALSANGWDPYAGDVWPGYASAVRIELVQGDKLVQDQLEDEEEKGRGEGGLVSDDEIDATRCYVRAFYFPGFHLGNARSEAEADSNAFLESIDWTPIPMNGEEEVWGEEEEGALVRAVPLETFLDAGRWGGAEGCPYVRGWNAETWKKTEAE